MDKINPFVILGAAIVSEVIGTTALKASDGFSKITPSVITVIAYAFTFWFLSLTLKTIPTGIAYAIWSGVGIVLISLVSWIMFKQALDGAALVGIGLIMAGVIVINVFSKSLAH